LIAIVVQTTLSLALCFVVGFATAWIIRGGREERKFQVFFDGWRGRYDKLERDCDVHLQRIATLQRDIDLLRSSNAPSAALPVAPKITE
jgi:hypothetical protein